MADMELPGRLRSWPVRRPEARRLDDVVQSFLRKTGLHRRAQQGQIEQRWREAAGAGIAAHTRVVAFRSTVLRVEVDSSALLHELVSFHRAAILSRLRSGDSPLLVRDVRFELGSR